MMDNSNKMSYQEDSFSVECGRKGGQKSRSFKMTKQVVETARDMRANGVSARTIAKLFGVSERGLRTAMERTDRVYPETLN